jgi:hypothetical protein
MGHSLFIEEEVFVTMVRLWRISTLILLILTYSYPVAVSGEKHEGEYKGSKDFERLKQIVGVWEGTTSMGEGKEDQKFTVEYKLTSGGSAIVETLFPGTPHEMVSVYYDKDGRLEMTHYCMLGNRPQMTLKKADHKNMTFELSGDSEIKVDTEPHMHALTISFVDDNNIVESWKYYENGRTKETSIFKLKRTK